MVIGWGVHVMANHSGPQVGLILIKRVSINSDLRPTPLGAKNAQPLISIGTKRM